MTKRTLHCSFCTRPDSEVTLLFQGVGAVPAYVCDGCLRSFAIIADLDQANPALADEVVRAINARAVSR
jgi:hypothetical protein